MKTYLAVVDKDTGSAYGVWFPDVQGCFSAADARGDVIRNAIEALSLHLEGREPPDARDVIAIAEDPNAKEALDDGAFLLAIPYVTTAHKHVRANISLDRGTLAAIDAAASERGLTRSSFIAEATKNEIEGR